jgi:tRNA modification GTPase
VKASLDDIRNRFHSDPIVPVSALRGEGIDDLKNAIYSSLMKGDVKSVLRSIIVANLRHKIALEKAEKGLLASREGLEGGISLEFVAFEIRSALEALGEIVGETTTEEVLDRIFEQFCIGK